MALTAGASRDLALGAGGSYSASRDIQKHFLWDTWLLPATVANHTYFMQGVGSPWGAGVKTINETNLYDSGKLPNGQTFLAKKIGVSCITASPQTNTPAGQLVVQAFVNMLQSSVFEIQIQGRSFDLQMHGSKFTPAISLSQDTAATINSVRVGDYVASGWMSLDDYPIFIDSLVGFSVVQTLGNPIAAIVTVINAGLNRLNGLGATLQLLLEGTLTRAK